MRIVTFTTLYPNAAMPSHGIFVENRLRHLVAHHGIEARVLAPSPWFPFDHPRFGDYGRYARVPAYETRSGIEIEHPRYFLPPKIGMNVAPFTLALGALATLRRLRAEANFDLIDAHYFYPDGVAAVILGHLLGKPVTITARGSDLSLYPKFALPRRLIRWAARSADGLITVCKALMDELEAIVPDLPQPAERRRVLRNGVDLDNFRPLVREAVRRELGLVRPTLLSVGHLIPRKGHDIVIRAMPLLPDFDLLIAGEGPERGRLLALIDQLRLTGRVRLVGQLPHQALARYYGAADALILASSHEGWANVLLEAMACGTPTVASNVWGTPEVVAEPAAGRLMRERTPEALADAVRDLFKTMPERSATRAYAERFSWHATSEGQEQLFKAVLTNYQVREITLTETLGQ